MNNFFEELVSIIPGHLYWKDKDGYYLGCNDEQAKSLGYSTASEIIGKTDFDLSSYDIAQKIRDVDIEVIKEKKQLVREEIVHHESGTNAIMLSKKKPVLNADGDVIGIIGISINITSQKENEKYKLQKEKAEALASKSKLLTASIAHELRTPLSSINSYADGIQLYLPDLIDAYKKAKIAKLPVANLRSDELALLDEAVEDIKKETHYTNVFINMLLMNLSQDKIEARKLKPCHIKNIVDEALARYPLSHTDRKLITSQINGDFEFLGDETLTIHLLFNLLRNALHYVKTAGKGEITLQTQLKDTYNYLYFTDTGTGIPKRELAKIFEKFYSKTRHGSGVGLSFCKMLMKSYNGDIHCDSVEGEYTRFIMRFPKYATVEK